MGNKVEPGMKFRNKRTGLQYEALELDPTGERWRVRDSADNVCSGPASLYDSDLYEPIAPAPRVPKAGETWTHIELGVRRFEQFPGWEGKLRCQYGVAFTPEIIAMNSHWTYVSGPDDAPKLTACAFAGCEGMASPGRACCSNSCERAVANTLKAKPSAWEGNGAPPTMPARTVHTFTTSGTVSVAPAHTTYAAIEGGKVIGVGSTIDEAMAQVKSHNAYKLVVPGRGTTQPAPIDYGQNRTREDFRGTLPKRHECALSKRGAACIVCLPPDPKEPWRSSVSEWDLLPNAAEGWRR